MATNIHIPRETIRATLSECLRFLAGPDTPTKFLDEMDVLAECDLDSEDGVEIACDLSTRLGITIPAKDNPLVDDGMGSERRRARTFGEVVEYLASIQTERE